MPLPDLLRALGKKNLTPGGLVMAERAFSKTSGLQPNAADLLAHITVIRDTAAGNRERYAAAVIQGLLSFDDDATKRKRLETIASKLVPGGRIVLHEFVWRQLPPRELLDGIPSVWAMPFYPLTTHGWWDLLDVAGFTDIESCIGTWSWFRLAGLHRDEGEDNAAEIMLGALDDDALRTRYLRVLDHAERHARFYGSIVLSARRKETR